MSATIPGSPNCWRPFRIEPLPMVRINDRISIPDERATPEAFDTVDSIVGLVKEFTEA